MQGWLSIENIEQCCCLDLLELETDGIELTGERVGEKWLIDTVNKSIPIEHADGRRSSPKRNTMNGRNPKICRESFTYRVYSEHYA